MKNLDSHQQNYYTPPKNNSNSFQEQEQIKTNKNINIQSQQEQNQRQYDSQQNKINQQNENKKIIKNYILGQTIGQGTFNKVKIARHILTNQKVAIKVIDKSTIQNQADKKRLNLQLKILRKVRHPNIAQLYEILQDKNYLYLITQYVSRGELFDHIVDQQRLTQFEASKFLQQLLDAIQYIHSLGVAHRDLKPENLLLDFKYNLKLIDFGLSNIYSSGELLKTACGSPCYASPQMLKGKQYDGLKSDIWSIGIVLYAMCFGYLPFDNPNTSQLYKLISKGEYQIEDHASKELISILKIILQVDPQNRATINQIRSHPFCKFSPIGLIPGIIVGLSDIPYQKQIQDQIVQEIYFQKNLNQKQRQNLRKQLKHSIKFNKHNELSSTYYLILKRNLRTNNQTVINYYIKKNNSINRYSIAEKVKQIYDKKLKEKLQKSKLINKNANINKILNSKQVLNSQIFTNIKNNKESVQSSAMKNIKTQKKQKQVINFIQKNNLLKNIQKQKNSQKKERQIQTTNTKRSKQINKKDKQNKKMIRKQKLNFNQIQLQQKNGYQKSSKKRQKVQQTPNNKKNYNFLEQSQINNINERPRNKSLNNINSNYKKFQLNQRQKSPFQSKKISNTNTKSKFNTIQVQMSDKKKRSKSQNPFTKNIIFKNKDKFKLLQKTDQINQNLNSGKKSNIKRKSNQKLKSKNSLIYEMTD